MPAYKDKNGTWYVVTQYTEWTGERKSKCKRGFATKREALNWETKFHQQLMGDLDMTFAAFVEIYYKDMRARLKESTWQTKENIIEQKILPYFGTRKINEITTRDVRAWQTEMLAIIDGYAISTNRGVDVLKYLAIPKFDSQNRTHMEIAGYSKKIHDEFKHNSAADVGALEGRLNSVVRRIFE